MKIINQNLKNWGKEGYLYTYSFYEGLGWEGKLKGWPKNPLFFNIKNSKEVYSQMRNSFLLTFTHFYQNYKKKKPKKDTGETMVKRKVLK